MTYVGKVGELVLPRTSCSLITSFLIFNILNVLQAVIYVDYLCL
jgi:hypothetical protein